MPPDPQRRNEQSHAAILDATIEQLSAVGYHRLTIEKVAAQAGVGKATVYRWWPSKALLVSEALGARCELVPVTPSGDLRRDVRALVNRAIEFVTASPIGHTLPQLAADLASQSDGRSPVVDCLGPVRAAHLSLLYGAAGRAELPHDIDANLLLDVIVGTVLYRTLLGQETGPEIVDQLTELIVDQQLPRASARRDQLI